MEILQILAKLTGLPQEAVVRDFLATANELGMDTENLSLEDIKKVLETKLNTSFPEAVEKLSNQIAH
jgi:hypothetical protein